MPIVLTEEPEADVTVRCVQLQFQRAVGVSESSLTFTKDNYSTAQYVTVTALVDSDAADELVNRLPRGLEIDGSYYEVARIRAFINDPISPTLTLSTPTLSVNEGETATYTIVPAAEPSRNFTITLASSDTESVTVSPPTIYLHQWGPTATGRRSRRSTVTGVQDDDEFDDVALHPAPIATYSGIDVYTVGQRR